MTVTGIVCTGGGSKLISDLMSHGGASSYIHCVDIPYSCESVNEYIGFTPKTYCSEEVAKNLALSMLRKLERLNPGQHCHSFSITASLAKKNQREDRVNQYFICYMNSSGTVTLENRLLDNTLSRYEQEEKICQLDIQYRIMHNIPVKYDSVKLQASKVFAGENIYIPINSQVQSNIIYPGSFNPYHDGHKFIIENVYNKYNRLIDLEISVSNVDKPYVFPDEIIDRVKQNFGPFVGGVWLTNLPKFEDKIKFFTKHVFVVGMDTFNRIFDVKYYKSIEERDAFINRMRSQCLTIIPRHGVTCQATMSCGNWIYLQCTPPNISSTEIREGK